MNINESIRDKRKLVEKNKVVYLQNYLYLLLTIVDYKTWYQIKVEALYFDQNDSIYELSNMNIHNY